MQEPVSGTHRGFRRLKGVRPTRRLGTCLLLLLGAVACGGPGDEESTPSVPPAETPTSPVLAQAPPGSGPSVMIAAVPLDDLMSDEEIRWLLAAHGIDERGSGGSGAFGVTVPQSQAAFAIDLLRRDGPRLGRWVFVGEHAAEVRPEKAPQESAWTVLAADLPFEEALETYPQGTPAGELLRHPVVRAWGRVFPRVRSLRGFTRHYRDGALQQREGLHGKLELSGPELDGTASRGAADFMGIFQAWEDGSRVELLWWAMGTVPDPAPDSGAEPAPVVGANICSMRSVEWMLRTLQDAGLAPFPLSGTPRPTEQAYVLFGVPPADAPRARELLRTNKPEWVIIDVVGD